MSHWQVAQVHVPRQIPSSANISGKGMARRQSFGAQLLVGRHGCLMRHFDRLGLTVLAAQGGERS